LNSSTMKVETHNVVSYMKDN